MTPLDAVGGFSPYLKGKKHEATPIGTQSGADGIGSHRWYLSCRRVRSCGSEVVVFLITG